MNSAPFTPGPPYSVENLAEARRIGAIVGDIEDNTVFNHRTMGLFDENTRGIPRLCREIIAIMRKNATVLISGHGAGSGTSDVFHMRPDIIIYSSGLSPVDPYHPFIHEVYRQNYDTYRKRINACLHLDCSTLNKDEYTIQQLQQVNTRVFHTVLQPYIRKQLIVREYTTPHLVPPIDFLCDHYGYSLYCHKPSSQQVMFQMLSPTGCMYMHTNLYNTHTERYIHGNDVVVIDGNHILLAKEGSLVAEKLVRHVGTYYENDSMPYKVTNLTRLESALLS